MYCVKLYASFDTLQRKAEDMKLKLPFSLLSKNSEMDVVIALILFYLRTGKTYFIYVFIRGYDQDMR